MANKIKCTCGHSWSTADSSAKDKYVCHICGKDNTMKDGGWLNKYDNGGEYLGTTNKGFDYNGAWGGPSMQVGGSILKFLEPTSKKLPEGYNPIAKGSSTEYAVSIGGEDGEPAYLIPSFKYGELLLDPKAEFRRTGEHLGGPFKTYQEADEWERTVRHPYVEKGQTIPTPIKRWGDMAMGGDIPQAQVGLKALAPITADDVSKFFSLFSIPQKTLTKLVTGEYQTPSEAMNVTNPVGAFAIDAVLDPVNLLGVGAIGKAAKASTKSGALSKAYKYNPLAFKPNPEANYRMLGSKGYDDALESGVIRPPQTQYPSTNFENAFYNKGYPLDTRFRDLTGRAGYEGPYMVEVKGNEELFVNDNPYGYTGPMFADPVYYSKQNIPIDKKGVKFYKENWLQGYKKVKPPKKQNGGEIPIDPMGYWNPENVGGPVIIPSNIITMKDVDQPLLGISDTGDVQMMYPGEDYEFDGESVTEYPIAQKGLKIPAPTTADSARLFNAQMALNKFYEDEMKAGKLQKQRDYKLFEDDVMFSKEYLEKLHNENLNFYRQQIKDRERYKFGAYDDEYKNLFNLSPEQVRNLEYKGLGQTKASSEYQKYYRDLITPAQNLATPFALVDLRIHPQRIIDYKPKESVIGYPGENVSVYDYDPLAIKPYYMRTTQEKIDWEKKYGPKPKPQTKPKPKPQTKPTVKPEPAKEQPIKEIKKEQPKPVERKQNVYEGSPVYSPGTGSGLPSALIGFANQKGDTTYIKPEDYERFAVPKYGKEYIESKTTKKKNGGWLDKYK